MARIWSGVKSAWQTVRKPRSDHASRGSRLASRASNLPLGKTPTAVRLNRRAAAQFAKAKKFSDAAACWIQIAESLAHWGTKRSYPQARLANDHAGECFVRHVCEEVFVQQKPFSQFLHVQNLWVASRRYLLGSQTERSSGLTDVIKDKGAKPEQLTVRFITYLRNYEPTVYKGYVKEIMAAKRKLAI
jgi:hypothetical protein